MAISRTSIMRQATGESYRRGQDIFLVSRRIGQYEAETDAFSGVVTARAEIQDASGDSHLTEVCVSERSEQITFHACDCPEAAEDPGHLCRHCVALLLKYISRRDLAGRNQRSRYALSDQVGSELIRSYSARAALPAASGNIELVPHLVIEEKRYLLELKIGSSKKYIIKNLLDFYQAMQSHAHFEYGQSLKFQHERSAFAAESLPLLDFVMTLCDAYLTFFSFDQTRYLNVRALRPLRAMPLSSADLGKLLNLMLGSSIHVKYGEMKKTLPVTTADPLLPVTLMQEKADRSWLIKSRPVKVLPCSKGLWLMTDEKICLTSPEYEKDMRLFLDRMPRLGDQPLHISPDMQKHFTGSVIKKISSHVVLDTNGLDLAPFMPPETVFRFYLDLPEPGVVTCQAYAAYGDDSYAVTEEASPDQGYRDLAGEQAVLHGLESFFDRVPKSLWQADFAISDDDQKVYQLLESGMDWLHMTGQVYISDQMKQLRIISPPKAQIGVSVKNDLLDLTIRSDALPYDELSGILDSYRRRRKFYRLKSGQFLRLEDNALSVLSELADGLRLSGRQMRGESIQVPLYRAGYIDSVLEQRGEDVQSTRDRLFKSLIRKLKSVRDSDYEVPGQMSGILRDYQKTGYRWLMTITELGFGGILADDMGLGKTLQVITLLTAYKEAGRDLHALIVCPSSLVYNWESEIMHFSPSLSVLLVTGSAQERADRLQAQADYDVVVTSYDMLKRDISLYEEMTFRFQVIDEAQYIKNSRTQAASSVKRVHAKTRFALTGTPIENRLSELWSIFDYLMPGFLYSYPAFREELEQPIVEVHDEIASARLRQMIRPFILRRMKRDVLKELPDKVERPVYARLTGEQQKLYDANLMQLLQMLDGQSESAYRKGKLEVLSALTRLRQICCDPALIYEGYDGGSAKLDTCLQLIENAMAGGHRVLLFSQFTSMLDLIEGQLKKMHIDHYRLDGSTRSDVRLQLVNSFNQNDIPVFLISLKAGGNGLNLTGADIVIHYDPWWNTAAQDQATDRTYRIGQDKNVMVYKLIARDTIEEKILALQDAKRALADEVISEELSGIAAFDKEELMAILR